MAGRPYLQDALWRDATPRPFWLDRSDRPAPRPHLPANTTCDLAIVGGGYSGLWAALLAKEREPDLDVLLIEAERIGWAASGRNGGFCAASITHGQANGRQRWPREFDELEQLGLRNLDEIEKAVAKYGIDCDFERTGELDVATEPYQVRALRERGGGFGDPDFLDTDFLDTDFLDTEAVRAQVNSPTYLAGRWDRQGCAVLDPARLAWGLARAAQSLGVRIVEQTSVTGLARAGTAIELSTALGTVRAGQAALGTNAFSPLLRRLRLFTVPVYDYVLMTEPLSAGQLASIGWANRQGIGDSANQFHYYRLSADNRILWGGYDAIYHYGRGLGSQYDQRDSTFALLARQFYDTFPQLTGLPFSHRWGGAIDTSTRFCAFYGTAMKGQVAYALGYTGLGVGASRFGANVMLDLLAGRPTERTRLEMVRSAPVPFPPEPLAYAGIEITRRSLARADSHQGRRNLWLRALDRFGLGFDS